MFIGVQTQTYITSVFFNPNFHSNSYCKYNTILSAMLQINNKNIPVLLINVLNNGHIAHQPLLVSENQSDCPFVWYQNIRSAVFGFVTKHACDRQMDGRTDRWTDRITTANTTLVSCLPRNKQLKQKLSSIEKANNSYRSSEVSPSHRVSSLWWERFMEKIRFSMKSKTEGVPAKKTMKRFLK